MAATPESKVKKKVVDLLKQAGAYYFYPVTGGFGVSGVPDIVVCYYGRFIGIECKAGSNKPTPLQQQNLEKIAVAGGRTMVVNEDNIYEVESLLSNIKESHYGQT